MGALGLYTVEFYGGSRSKQIKVNKNENQNMYKS